MRRMYKIDKGGGMDKENGTAIKEKIWTEN